MRFTFDNGPADFLEVAKLEWLETNGVGGYASGTVSGAHTRRYHGLLIAATKPPLGRALLLSKFEETLFIGDAKHELSCNRYPETVDPNGYLYLKRFEIDPFPTWTFEVEGVRIEKQVFQPHGSSTTVLRYSVDDPRPDVRLELRPLLAFRDHHHLRQNEAGFDTAHVESDGRLEFTPVDGMPTLFVSHNAASVEPSGYWYRDLEYDLERERGFDFTEMLYQPCVLGFSMGESAHVIASTDPDAGEPAELLKNEAARRRSLAAEADAEDEVSATLARAADQFVVSRGSGKTVIAGYHWFDDWGRDTMIAIPGLALATGRSDIAREIIGEYIRHVSQGMLPNRFTSGSETPDYNNVDATLWYFEAIRAYAEATGDHEFIRTELFAKLVNVITWHIAGTRYGICLDSDGLLAAGEPGENLTWMDAKIDDLVITPRQGKAVEIQALWYNAVSTMAEWATLFGESGLEVRFRTLADKCSESFNLKFWNDDAGCLYDVIDGDERDARIRPNQIFAVSLHHSMLDAERSRAVVKRVENDLLTPFGLRSLAAYDPRYVGVYTGTPFERDSAYHQGTVWSWLIGPFVEAYLKVNPRTPAVLEHAAELLRPLEAHLNEAMLGSISEIFDADPPHRPKGAAAQAWSVAELIRARKLVSAG